MCLVQLPVRHIFCYTVIIVLVIVLNVNCGMKRGGGANTKVPDMYGVGGGVFGTQNTKVTCALLYNKGGCPMSIFYP